MRIAGLASVLLALTGLAAPAQAQSTDAALSGLSLVSGVTLEPGFAADTTEYRAWVANSVSSVTVVEGATPASALPHAKRERDLGWMLHDIDHANGRTPRFFRARLEGGVIDVPRPDDARVRG